MATQLNRAEIIGYLGSDPESHTYGSATVTRLRIATTRKWKGKDGKDGGEETEWHNVACWGQIGTNAAKYLKKGRYVRVVGRMHVSEYEKDGAKHRGFEIIATEPVGFLDSTKDRSGGGSDEPPAGWEDRP